MRQGIQTFLSNVGETGCYALCVIKLAEKITGKPYDVVTSLEEGIAKNYIYYNNILEHDNDNFYMNNPAGFLSYLINKPVKVKKTIASYIPKENEYEVYCWEYKKYTHFTLPNFDPLFNSQTVKRGRIASKRIFTIL